MGKLTGAKIKEARTAAKLSQEKLAQMLTGVTAADISKAERGEKELTQAALKAIAKATGVTQASLLNAEKDTGEKKAAAKTATAKTSAKSSGKTAAKTGTAKKSDGYELTAAEKKLIDLYRAASSEARTDATRILKGEKSEVEQLVSTMLGGSLNLDTIAKLLKNKK